MKKRKIIEILLILIGTGLIAFPIISAFINSYTQTVCISSYQSNVDSMEAEKKQREIERAREYNANLDTEATIDLSLKSSGEEEIKYPSYDNILNVGEVIGYINIPKIDVYLPIYHGTSEDVLQSGVGHLERTSLPVGGLGTHCVLAGHTGLSRMKMFDNIDKLVMGDTFCLHILDEVLTYSVDNINVVKPEDVTKLTIEPDKDYVTLVSCTPYMINTHRLLVRGTRIENSDIQGDVSTTNQLDEIAGRRKLGIVLSITITTLVFALLVAYIIHDKKKKRVNEVKGKKNSKDNSQKDNKAKRNKGKKVENKDDDKKATTTNREKKINNVNDESDKDNKSKEKKSSKSKNVKKEKN